MKKITFTTKEKGTDNVKFSCSVSGIPETLEEILSVTPEESSDRALSFFMAGLEASAKQRLEHGESTSYEDLLKRSGRRTQGGLIQSIMKLVPEAAEIGNTVVVVQLMALQADVMSAYKGNADALYMRYQSCYNSVQDSVTAAAEAREAAKAEAAEAKK
jgi:hypothetical protein